MSRVLALHGPQRLLRASRGAAAVWALNVLLLASAAALIGAVDDLRAPVAGVHLPWWLLAAGFAATELCVIHVHVRRSAHSLTLGELPLVLGLVFASPADLVLAWIVGAAIALTVSRTPPVRFAFNLGLFAWTALLASVVFHVTAGDDLGPRTWFAAAAAALLSASASSLLIASAMTLSGEDVGLPRVAEMLRFSAVVAATNASLGLAVAAVVEADPLASVLLLSPAAVIFVAYRAYHSERQRLVSLEFLFDAGRALNRAGDAEAGLAGMLALALTTFRAELAEVCLLPADEDEAGTSVVVRAEEGLEVRRDLSPAVTQDALALLGEDPHARLVDVAALEGPLGDHLRALGARDAMVAGLPGDRRLVGAAVMANRVGVGGGFDRHDVQLFETLAAHTGATLGQDRLERRVTTLSASHDELYHQAFHDPLTGLANRLLFRDRVDHALSRRGGNVAVLYIDLDDFKPVNDTLGHEAGDELLRTVGVRLRESLRDADTPARLGGDEFAVLLVDIAAADVPTVAERILANFARTLELCGREVAIHASLGVAMADSGEMPGDELLRNADAAMYASKHGGKRGYRIYGAR